MLTPETKRHIDNARQVLVGKVPDPKSQINEITNALVYKFMDDMDDQSAAIGGKRRYFVGDYEKYSWKKLMAESMGAHDRLTLYREALERMSKNPGLPELFRSIFRNAYLPFNDARTLSLFLKEIDHFNYIHSEELGNAYEYLLSIMGSQGNAGQFRTPRHIIDFIVAAVNPTKDDSVLDPACGTAGFLISAYKHVVAKHDGKDDISGVLEQNTNELRLTADERKKIYNSYHGFDIDDNMVKMAKVNMYLHSFPEPNIVVHDSLSSEDYWNVRYDVILANPPFMTPKGGIVPHKRFGIQANRAEVLFVDYIASHLKPTGRAGIIVPEGIIFQSGKAYKDLRKNLVENYLYAVVSLPAGVFQPYSGVKTSILLLDKELAKKRDEILFVKIENDGLSLGAQRRFVNGNQLPEALDAIDKFKNGDEVHDGFVHSTTRQYIAESGDYNLSGDRYKIISPFEHGEFPTISLSELEAQGEVNFLRGSSLSKKDIDTFGKYKCIHYGELYTLYGATIKDVYSRTNLNGKVLSDIGDVLVPATTTAGPEGIAIARSLNEAGIVLGGDINIIRTKNRKILGDYLSWVINYPLKETLSKYATGVNIYHLSNNDLRKLNIILPPLEIQREVVAELDGYQKIIDAAHTIIKTYKPTIKINPEWQKEVLQNLVTETKLGIVIAKKDQGSGSERYIKMDAIKNGEIDTSKAVLVDVNPKEDDYLVYGDFVYNTRNAPNLVGKSAALKEQAKYLFNNNILRIRFDHSRANSFYIAHVMNSEYGKAQINRFISGTTSVAAIYQKTYLSIEIPLPPIEIQREIVAKLEAEQQLIEANKKLMEIYQKKIKEKIAEVWGERS